MRKSSKTRQETSNWIPGQATLDKYGLDAHDWQEMFTRQNGACPICRRRFADDLQPVTDHCHEYGHVRALLCGRCNILLGTACDNQTLLFQAAEYLGKHHGRYIPEEFVGESAVGSPYRKRGYTADACNLDASDCLTLRRHGKIIAEVYVGVLPEGPHAPASINIRRFKQNEFQRIRVIDDFDG